MGVWDQIGMFEREVAIYRRLQKRGVQVAFVTYGSAEDLRYADRIPGIQILCNKWGLPVRVYRFLLPVLHCLSLIRASVYKTNQANGAEIALRAARFWGKPMIARCGYMWSSTMALEHGADNPLVRHAQEIEESVFSAAQRVVVTAPMMASDIAGRIPTAAKHTVLIPNYVDTELFIPGDKHVPDYDIIFVGRMSREKNVVALLKAIQSLDVRTAFIGSGELRDELQQRFASLNSRVQWLGNILNAELPLYLNRAGAFVLPSHYEGHPKTLIEAMACGRPVIGTDVPGIREIIQHRQTGYLCGTSPTEIRRAIQDVLGDEALQERMGGKAREYVVENFSLDRVFEMELALLQEVTNVRKA